MGPDGKAKMKGKREGKERAACFVIHCNQRSSGQGAVCFLQQFRLWGEDPHLLATPVMPALLRSPLPCNRHKKLLGKLRQRLALSCAVFSAELQLCW